MAPPPDPPAPAVLSQEDLAAYLERIHFPTQAADLRPDAETLKALHRAHDVAIPFENLAIHIGGPGEMPIRLDLESLMDKLVRRKRGGYCFEQNSLLLTALAAIGFTVTPFEPRVRAGVQTILPSADFVFSAHAAPRFLEGDWLRDAGLGRDRLFELFPCDGIEPSHSLRPYRVVETKALKVFSSS